MFFSRTRRERVCATIALLFTALLLPSISLAAEEWIPNSSTGLLESSADSGTGAESAGAGTAAKTLPNAAEQANIFCSTQNNGTPCTTTVGMCTVSAHCDARICKADYWSSIGCKFVNRLEDTGIGTAVGFVTGSVTALFRNALTPKPATTPPQIVQPQCPNGRFRVTAPTTDPCAIYIPPVTPLNNSDTLLRTLGIPSTPSTPSTPAKPPPPSVGNILLNQVQNVVAPGSNPGAGSVEITPVPSGANGLIVLTPTGATIKAELRDTERNIEVAGFFGAKTLTDSIQSLAERMCIVRQWQHPMVSERMPIEIFDQLCSNKGLKVGLPASAVPVAVAKSTTANKPAPSNPVPAPSATSTPVGPVIAPAAAIWASPDSVPLGSRSTIYWNSKGVTSCVETSPDGNFTGNSKSGHASTVAIVGQTTFTISCLAPDGSHVTDFVTVNLAI